MAAPRTRSPRRRIACEDFEGLHIALPASAVLSSNNIIEETNTAYSPQTRSPLVNIPSEQTQNPGGPGNYRNSTHAFLDKCRLPPLVTRATNSSSAPTGLDTPPPSQPPSGASSPTKSLASFITANSNTASTASVRAKHASKQLFDNFFTGTSAPLNIGILPTWSQQSVHAQEVDEEYPAGYEMEGSFTRAPTRTGLTQRLRRSDTASSSSTTYGVGKLGSWFTGSRNSTSSPVKPSAGIAPEDPLLNLNITNALFPHGPADPLDPTSFHDLLSSAESVIATYRLSYRLQYAEVRDLRAEAAVQKEEVEEMETRAEHLKMQLDGMAAQLDAQAQRADKLEKMLEEERSQRKKSDQFERRTSRKTSVRLVQDEQDESEAIWKRGNASDSGFESDGESVFSAGSSPSTRSDTTTSSQESVGKMRREMMQPPPMFARPNHDILNPSAFGNADLRDENQQLKARVAELEFAIDGCMEMVSAPWTR